jgi:hypothetical protein
MFVYVEDKGMSDMGRNFGASCVSCIPRNDLRMSFVSFIHKTANVSNTCASREYAEKRSNEASTVTHCPRCMKMRKNVFVITLWQI